MRTSLGILVVFVPLLAQAQGAALAKKLESQKDPKQQQKLVRRVEKLSDVEKEAFVGWAKAKRLETKLPWKNLAKALGKIGTASAAGELGEVARYVNTSEMRGLSGRIKSALEALTLIPPEVSVPILLQGLRHSDRDVRFLHRQYLGRFAVEGVPLRRSATLRELVREANRLREYREELLEEDALEIASQIRQLTRNEELLTSLFADCVVRSNHLRDHLRLLVDSTLPATVLVGTVRGIAKRAKDRLAPLRRELRRIRSRRKREAKRRGDEVSPPDEDEDRRQVFRDKPQLERLWNAVQAELPRLEEALASIAESELPQIRFEVTKAVPAVRQGLTQEWANVMFPFLESKNTSWIVGTAKALTELTGETKSGQSRGSWEAWWKQQAGADE